MVVLGRRATALLYRQTFRRALELEWREELQQAEEVLHRWGLPQLEEAGLAVEAATKVMGRMRELNKILDAE